MNPTDTDVKETTLVKIENRVREWIRRGVRELNFLDERRGIHLMRIAIRAVNDWLSPASLERLITGNLDCLSATLPVTAFIRHVD
jgi:hypothetical protein